MKSLLKATAEAPGASDGQALRGVVMNITVLRWIRRARWDKGENAWLTRFTQHVASPTMNHTKVLFRFSPVVELG
jgi:hypothetical protein